MFAIKSEPPKTRKSDEESEGYLSFINPPDFNNPQDHNQDNIYEVEITFINLDDGDIIYEDCVETIYTDTDYLDIQIEDIILDDILSFRRF